MGRFRLKGRIRMSGGKKSRRTMLMAALTAGALALGYLAPAAFAEGGVAVPARAVAVPAGRFHRRPPTVHWIYKDSWPATLEGMKQAIRDSGTTPVFRFGGWVESVRGYECHPCRRDLGVQGLIHRGG